MFCRLHHFTGRVFAALVLVVTFFVAAMPGTAFARSTPHTTAEKTVTLPGVHSTATLNAWVALNAANSGGNGVWTYNSSEDAVYEASNVGLSGFYNPNANYGKMRVWLDCKSPDGDDDFMGIMFRTKSTSGSNMSTYMFVLTGKGSGGGDKWVWPDGQPTNYATHNASGLYKITNAPWAVASPKLLKLASSSHLTFSHSAYQHIEVSVDGGHIVIKVDGVTQVDYTDPNPIDTGSYGFWNYSQGQTYFKNIGGAVERAEYKVTYNSNGANSSLSTGGTSYTSYEVSTWNYDTPPTATRTGYDFAGWYTAASGGTNFTSSLSGTVNIANDIQLYAHWTPHTYIVKFDGNGNTGGSTADLAMTYDTAKNLTANGFTRYRYTWKGWSANADGTGTQYTNQQSVNNLTATQGGVVTLHAKWERDYGYLDLEKSSAIPGITSGNAAYSLAGAVFTVYSDAACTKSVGTFTTDANGNADALHLPTETYYVKETTVPTGYLANTTTWTVEVFKDETTWLRVSDTPGTAPSLNVVQKLDAQATKDQGDAVVSGALVTVRYFDNNAGTTTGTPKRTWVFRTDASGGVTYDAVHKASGDELYVNGAGSPVMPFGTYTVTETAAPSGYCLSDVGAHAVRVVLDSAHTTTSFQNVSWSVSGVGTSYGGRGIVDEVQRGEIVMTKYDADFASAKRQGDTSLASAEFSVTNRSANAVVVGGVTYEPGEVVMRILTDGDGVARTGGVLPYGTYDVVEESAPVGYDVDGVTHTFEVRADGATYSDTATDDIWRGTLKVRKRDGVTGEDDPEGLTRLDGAKFELTNESATDVVVDGVTYGVHEVIATLTTDEHGRTEISGLPYGTYRLREVEESYGYVNAGLDRTFTIRSDDQVVDMTSDVENTPYYGSVSIEKVDADTMRDVAQGDATLAGAKFEVVTTSFRHVSVNGRVFEQGEVVLTLYTNETGRLTTGDVLPYGTYVVREVEPSLGYANDGFVRSFEVSSSQEDFVYTVADPVLRDGFSTQKKDADLPLGNLAQGDATFEGTRVGIFNETASYVVLDGVVYPKGALVRTIVTDVEGFVESGDDLAYGHYTLRELVPPVGYLRNETWSDTFFVSGGRVEAARAQYLVFYPDGHSTVDDKVAQLDPDGTGGDYRNVAKAGDWFWLPYGGTYGPSYGDMRGVGGTNEGVLTDLGTEARIPFEAYVVRPGFRFIGWTSNPDAISLRSTEWAVYSGGYAYYDYDAEGDFVKYYEIDYRVDMDGDGIREGVCIPTTGWLMPADLQGSLVFYAMWEPV